MSVIQTTTELEQLPVGTKVKVGDKDWERVTAGLMSTSGSGTILGLHHFTGYIAEKKITMLPTVHVGRWYHANPATGPGWTWLVTEVVADGFYGLGFNENHELSSDRTSQVPPDTNTDGMVLIDERDERQWMRTAYSYWSTMHTAIPRDLRADLIQHATRVDDEDLDAMMLDYGMGIERDHEVDVLLTGHTYWTPSHGECRDQLGDNFTVDEVDDSVTIRWTRSVSITKRGIGCTCDEVEREDVDDYLPPDYETWDFTAECG